MGNYYNPVHIHFSLGEIKNISNIIKNIEEKVESILLITRGGNFNGSIKHIELLEGLKEFSVMEYGFTNSNPDIKDLYSLMNETKDVDYDVVVAVGGGSVLDIAKSICFFKGTEIQSIDQLRELITNKESILNNEPCKWIGIPTTSGTGSEVTPWATIWDKEKGLKYSVAGKKLFAYAAIVDPEFTTSLPIKITISTSLDALCHATEAYWAKASNEFSRNYALSAIENLVENIKKISRVPEDKDIRAGLAMGSLLAGLAFSNTKTTSCHSISYPLTLKHGIPHGIAVAITLSSVIKHNEKALVNKGKLLKAFGVNKIQNIETLMLDIFNTNEISPKLRDYGVKEEELKEIVDNSYTKGRMDNNPIKIEKEELLNMLNAIY